MSVFGSTEGIHYKRLSPVASVSQSYLDGAASVTADGTVTTIAGSFSKAGISHSTNTVLSRPRGNTIDKSGNVFVILDQAVFQIGL